MTRGVQACERTAKTAGDHRSNALQYFLKQAHQTDAALRLRDSSQQELGELPRDHASPEYAVLKGEAKLL